MKSFNNCGINWFGIKMLITIKDKNISHVIVTLREGNFTPFTVDFLNTFNCQELG
jgi:hypothetical protein